MKAVYAVDIKAIWPLADSFDNPAQIISELFPRILIIASIILFFLIVIAGVGIIAGAGKDDPHAKEKSRNFLTYAVIGFIIIFGAFWILQIINFITGGSLRGILGG